MQSPRILYVDAYDSFANNIIALLQLALRADVHLVKIDDPYLLNSAEGDGFFDYLDQFDAVVVGPGPGHPGNKKDVGWASRIWNLPENHMLPVLGICLGFQSLCMNYGADVCILWPPENARILFDRSARSNVSKSHDMA